MKKTVLSGVQPSGMPSLGNYLGAFSQFVKFQDTHEAFYCVVDLHAITVRQDPDELRNNTYDIAAWFLASGLNPENCALFVQSHVHEHAELGWLLSTFTQMGELERMTQFKDKAARHKHNINAGLFTYPTLMAADILLYQAHEVPVGHDQTQHLELTRDIATRVNGAYGEVFTLPKAVIPKAAARVKDLQNPERKMSKSEAGGGCILLADEPNAIEKKIKRAVTDNEGVVRYDEANQPGVANLLGIFAACKNMTIEQAEAHFKDARYGDFKVAVAQAVRDELEPLQERYYAIMADKKELDDILAHGAKKARKRAHKTLAAVKDKIGLVKG